MSSNYFPPSKNELVVEILPRGYDQWTGSRAQLEAEGLVMGLSWQVDDLSNHAWEFEGFSYLLRRWRPVGLKGRMLPGVDYDCWRLRRCPAANAGDGFSTARIHEKRCELETAVWRETAAGKWWRWKWSHALADKSFQAFMRGAQGLDVPGSQRAVRAASDADQSATQASCSTRRRYARECAEPMSRQPIPPLVPLRRIAS